MRARLRWVVVKNMSRSYVISGENVDDDTRPWDLPNVEDAVAIEKENHDKPITASRLELIQKQAYDESYALGKEEGIKAGQNEIQERVQFLEKIMAALVTPFEDLDKEVDRELVNLALGIAQQLIRREIKSDPGQVIAVVREAIASLPMASRSVQLFLHPEDASIVSEMLTSSDDNQQWQIIEDPTLSRGGCRISTENSQVDATVETSLAAIFARIMGGQRESDQDE